MSGQALPSLMTRFMRAVTDRIADAGQVELVRDAMNFMIEVHAATPARPSGLPYSVHPLRVAQTLLEDFEISDPDIVVAGLLHDTVEDEPETVAALAEHEPQRQDAAEEALSAIAVKYGNRVSKLVRELTNPPFDSKHGVLAIHTQYLEHMQELFAGDHDVAVIKMADFLDNSLGLRRLEQGSLRNRLRQKYCPVAAFLLDYIPTLEKTHPFCARKDMLFAKLMRVQDRECQGIGAADD